MEYSRDNKMISFLIIKNKSELKVLLKQLNIEQWTQKKNQEQ